MDDFAFLQSLPMFSALARSELESVQKSYRVVRHPAGECIIRQGEMGADLYIVREGEVAVQIGANGATREVTRLGPGAVFGEMSLFDAYPRSATVLAVDDTVVYLLERDSFRTLSARYPDILFEMCRMFSARLRNTNRVVVEKTS